MFILVYLFTFCKIIVATHSQSLDDPNEITIQNNSTIISELMNCCKDGVYDPNTETCVGKNKAIFSFQLPCSNPIELDPTDVQIEKDAEELEYFCITRILTENEDSTIAYFTCEEMDEEFKITFEIWLFPISIVFLSITLYLYLVKLTWLRSPQDMAFMYAISCLMFHMIFFIVRYTNNRESQIIIIFYNYVGRYLKTAYFSWFHVMCFNRLIENRNLQQKLPYSKFHPIGSHIYAWTVPLIFITLYYYVPNLNWHIPILIMWIINLILLITVITSVEHTKQLDNYSWRTNRYRSWLLIRLFLGAGILWLFGASVRIPIFTVLFALQGVLIFLIMVIYRYHVKRKFAGEKFGVFQFPQHWKNTEDVDRDDINQNSQGDNNDFLVVAIPLEGKIDSK
uniref:CSON002507 protein n=1 Tax=Culicoides sonorensis TaxID=179676 RepID=A0A336LS03_CULSO